jgi:hypothetical protein
VYFLRLRTSLRFELWIFIPHRVTEKKKKEDACSVEHGKWDDHRTGAARFVASSRVGVHFFLA